MDLAFADIAVLKTVSRGLRIGWVSAVVAEPVIVTGELWRLLHSTEPLPVSESLLALTSALTCGFLCWFIVYLPRAAARRSTGLLR